MKPVTVLEEIGYIAHFSWRTLLALPSTLRNLGESMHQFYRVLIGSLPLGLVAGLAIGLVLWMHVRAVIIRPPAGEAALQYLPTALALAVVLEFAPIGAGLIVAGRVGANLAAELGAMKITEQIDAVEMLGMSPLKQLVAPRVLACILTLPLLTIFMAALALGGAFAAEMLSGSLNSIQYEAATWSGLHFEDVLPAIAKTGVFGFLVGVSGCYFGMKAAGGTEGVGKAATHGVELATLLVLLANVILVRLIQAFLL